MALLLAWGLAGVPGSDVPLGRYAGLLADHAVAERHTTNVVIATAFDYRALDTLGEEFLLFVAAVGTTVLLRATREERDEERAARLDEQRGVATSDSLRALGTGLVGPTVVLGVYVTAHGQLTPGGGFQGGVVLAAALLAVYVAGTWLALRHVAPVSALELSEAVGAGGFVLVGIGGLLFAAVFLENFLPFGTKGDVLSGGMVPLANLAVGLEVAGAFGVILTELLDQIVLRRSASG